MFGKRLFDSRAMGVTHRESGRASGKFGNVGVTHNV